MFRPSTNCSVAGAMLGPIGAALGGLIGGGIGAFGGEKLGGLLGKRLFAATSEANRYTADTALDVFGECVERYRAVAQAADGHANDVMTLDQAWPVSD